MSSKINYYSSFNPNYSYSISDDSTMFIDTCGVKNTYDINSRSALKFFTELDYTYLDSSLLIPGLRYTAPGILVFERPPTKKLIQYVDYDLDGLCQLEEEEDQPDIYENYIPIPWQVYIVTYSLNPASKYRVTSVRMYFSSTPLNHPDTTLYMPYVNNFFTNGFLCNPRFDTYDEISRYSQDLQGAISSAYDWIWNTGFNKDLYECVTETVKQTLNKNNIVNKLTSSKVYFNYTTVHQFYELLSNYEPHDVVLEQWANPSRNMYFTQDRAYYVSLAEKYIMDNNINNDEHYDEDCDDDDEQNEEDQEATFYQRTPYGDYINNPTKSIKTYKDIMTMIYDQDVPNHYRPLVSSPHIKNVETFSNLLNNSLSS